MENGKNFTGLVGDLFNKYTDIGWADLFFSLERSQFIDYTNLYMLDYGGFMVHISRIMSLINLFTDICSFRLENLNPYHCGKMSFNHLHVQCG